MKTTHALFKGSIILLVAMNLFAALNYVFQFVMVRLLEKPDYAILVVLMNLFLIFGVASEAIQTIITKYSSHEQNEGKIKNIIKKSLRKGVKFSIIGFIAFLFISIFLSYFLRIEYALFIISGLLIFSSILLPITRGVLQGKKRFTAFGFNLIAESLAKLIISFSLVFIGWKVYGAMLGVFLGPIVAFSLSLFTLRKTLKAKEEKAETPEIYSYSFPVISITLAVILFYTLDLFLAKRFFSPEIAGDYAIASTLAKIIFFGTVPISKAMFPISAAESARGKPPRHLLFKSLAFVAVCIAIALPIFIFFPDFIVWIFTGKANILASKVLIYLSIAASLLSFTNLIFLYKLSLGKIRNYYFIFLFIIFEIILLSIFHANLIEYSITLIFLNLLFLFGSIFLFNER